jgi:DNA repair protein RadD
MERDYQREAIDSVKQLWGSGKLNLLGVSAVRSGKTIIALSLLAEDMGPDDRAILLSHTLHLVDQPMERVGQFPKYGVLRPIGAIQGSRNAVDARFICATTDSLIDRLDAVLSHGKITHLIVDEAHRAVGNTHSAIIRKLREVNPELKLLLITATPNRYDQRGLIELADTVAFDIGIKYLIERGVLVPPVHMSFTGDNKIPSSSDGAEIMFEKWKTHAGDRQTVGFTRTVAESISLTRYWLSQGIPAVCVYGDVSPKLRKTINKGYAEGKIQVIFNPSVLIEGWDAQNTSCVIIARAAISPVTFGQAAGRGLGKVGDKTNCVILDFNTQDNRTLLIEEPLGEKREQPDQEIVEKEFTEREDVELKTAGNVKRAEMDLLQNYLSMPAPTLPTKVYKYKDKKAKTYAEEYAFVWKWYTTTFLNGR